MNWSKQQVRFFANQVKAEWSGGWPFFTNDVRRAVVDAKVLSIVRGQDRATIEVEAINELTAALRDEMKVSL